MSTKTVEVCQDNNGIKAKEIPKKNRSQIIDETLTDLIQLREKETIVNTNDYVEDGLRIVDNIEEHLQILSKVYSSLYTNYRKEKDKGLSEIEELNLDWEIEEQDSKEISNLFRELLKLSTMIYASYINPKDEEITEDLRDFKIKILKSGKELTTKELLKELKSYEY